MKKRTTQEIINERKQKKLERRKMRENNFFQIKFYKCKYTTYVSMYWICTQHLRSKKKKKTYSNWIITFNWHNDTIKENQSNNERVNLILHLFFVCILCYFSLSYFILIEEKRTKENKYIIWTSLHFWMSLWTNWYQIVNNKEFLTRALYSSLLLFFYHWRETTS